MTELAFHRYKYPFKPKCNICRLEQESMIHVDRTYTTDGYIIADSLYFCNDCIWKLESARHKID